MSRQADIDKRLDSTRQTHDAIKQELIDAKTGKELRRPFTPVVSFHTWDDLIQDYEKKLHEIERLHWEHRRNPRSMFHE
jgi:hypothetical protein